MVVLESPFNLLLVYITIMCCLKFLFCFLIIIPATVFAAGPIASVGGGKNKSTSYIISPSNSSSRVGRKLRKAVGKNRAHSKSTVVNTQSRPKKKVYVKKTSKQKSYRYQKNTYTPQFAYSGINKFGVVSDGVIYRIGQKGEKIIYSLSPLLQERAERLLDYYRVPWGAIVAIEPRTGRVLAMAGHSEIDSDGSSLTTRATFPAASLFKVVTASAAIEKSGLSADSVIYYRGGNYTLNRSNYNPDSSRDTKRMELATALGKSCNPVFARVALNNFSPSVLQQYARSFGFDRTIPFELPLQRSSFTMPSDEYEFARTAAGFGDVFISPLHAAMIAGTVANDGLMMEPHIVDRIVAANGHVEYVGKLEPLQRAVLSNTSKQVVQMMESTIEKGTARKHFVCSPNERIRSMRIAGKTGTLKGDNPKGIYHWFIASAPVDNPKIAIAALVIDPGTARIGGTGLGRFFLEYFFSTQNIQQVVQSGYVKGQEG